jgi:hypothetical protein
MRSLFAMLVGVAALSMGVFAEDKKDEKKTLEGSLVCTKCELKETKACGHALIVSKDEKKVTYYLVDKGAKEPYHGKVCSSPADAKVTGKIVEKKEGDKKKLTIVEPKVVFKE